MPTMQPCVKMATAKRANLTLQQKLKFFKPANSQDQVKEHWVRGLEWKNTNSGAILKKHKLLDTYKVNAGS